MADPCVHVPELRHCHLIVIEKPNCHSYRKVLFYMKKPNIYSCRKVVFYMDSPTAIPIVHVPVLHHCHLIFIFHSSILACSQLFLGARSISSINRS
jgi:hypothetical protein